MTAILFDMDGVLANVGSSYREAIIQTAAHFGVRVTHDDISVEKKKGNSNNDWVLSKRLIDERIPDLREITLEEVTNVFEEIYQGTATVPGLCASENLIPSRGLLQEIHHRCGGKVAVVTGRPRKDCEKFLKSHGLTDIFKVCICMEDAPAKPDPTPVLMACELIGMSPNDCFMIGDTPDDVRSAILAGVVPWGVLTPEEDARITLGLSTLSAGMGPSLQAAGAVCVMRAGLGTILDLIKKDIAEPSAILSARIGKASRETKETTITAEVNLDGSGIGNISTGLGFLDHMLSQLSKHGRFDISVTCVGDLHIDDHHTAEDCALALGEAFDKALGRREGINRFGSAYCPLDEALSRVVTDISSRPHAVVCLNFSREMIGGISTEMIKHVFTSFAMASRITLHVDTIHGENNHHIAESAFKALGVALRQAVGKDILAGIPSTKGVL